MNSAQVRLIGEGEETHVPPTRKELQINKNSINMEKRLAFSV
jgi:hypothetical protein